MTVPFSAKNVLGSELRACSYSPLTGFFRDGCCHTGPQDTGSHTVCALVDEAFLQFSLSMGNDLITPRPDYRFVGLKPGDRWCLCVSRWVQAHQAGLAPKVILEATHESVLQFVDLEVLERYAAA